MNDMHKLGDQWIEIIDGQEHMVKAVPGVSCNGCVFWQDENFHCDHYHDCEGGLIFKDLGILKCGCLPCPLCGKYPDIKDGGNVNLNYVFCHNSHIVKTIHYPNIQQAIDAWNRRV